MSYGAMRNLWLCAAMAQLIAGIAQAASSTLPERDAAVQALVLATQPYDPIRWIFFGAADTDEGAAMWLDTASASTLGDLVSTDVAIVKLAPDGQIARAMARFFFDCRRALIAAYPLGEPVPGAAIGATAFNPRAEALALSRALKEAEWARPRSGEILLNTACDFAREKGLVPAAHDSSVWPTRFETQLRASIYALNSELLPALDEAARVPIIVDFIETLAAQEGQLNLEAPTLTRFVSETHLGAAVFVARLPSKSRAGEEPIPVCVERIGKGADFLMLAAASPGKLMRVPANRFASCEAYLAAPPVEPPSWQEYR